MSIAVSAVVHRSRLLTSALLAMSVFCLCIGAAIGFDIVGTMLLLPRILLSAGCMLGVFALLHQIFRPHVLRRIDISGTGLIHIHEPPVPRACETGQGIQVRVDPVTHTLCATSTLWSFLMILNLRSTEGTAVTLIVMPDTMTQASFRSLCVACHWIAAHNIRAHAENS